MSEQTPKAIDRLTGQPFQKGSSGEIGLARPESTKDTQFVIGTPSFMNRWRYETGGYIQATAGQTSLPEEYTNFRVFEFIVPLEQVEPVVLSPDNAKYVLKLCKETRLIDKADFEALISRLEQGQEVSISANTIALIRWMEMPNEFVGIH